MLAPGLALSGGPCFACPAGAPVASDAKSKFAKQASKCLVSELRLPFHEFHFF